MTSRSSAVVLVLLVVGAAGCSGQSGVNGESGQLAAVPVEGSDRGPGTGDAPVEVAGTVPDTEASPIDVRRLLLDEINEILVSDLSELPSDDFAVAVSALQRRHGLGVTGSLSMTDIAFFQSRYGADTFTVGVSLTKTTLATAGYNVGGLDAIFDRQTQLALLALSHDAGAGPDAALSSANLGRLGATPVLLECAGSAVPFRIGNAQALVEHLDRVISPPAIVMIEPPLITDDPDLNQRIVDRARVRGYELRPLATELSTIADGTEVGSQAAPWWLKMNEAAASAGVTMYAASGYRSPERQRQIFVDELVAAVGTPLTSSQTSDAAIDQVLEGHAPPGFSKHQTGNAIDLAVPGLSLAQFRETDAFSWLAADNFANAHRFGFAPSYPDGVDGLGPAPEPWEWIWVGVDVLFRCPPPN